MDSRLARAYRTREATTLLIGMGCADSPLSLLDVGTARRIMAARCAPIASGNGGYRATRDPDTNDLQSANDQPAVVLSDGSSFWYRWGVLHRDNGLPASVWSSGRELRFVDGIAQPP